MIKLKLVKPNADWFLADCTNGRTIGIVLCPFVVSLYGMYCG